MRRDGRSSCCAAYDRKKYTWKLLYSHMMGFEVDFGHAEAAALIMSGRYDEKQVGYQALTILLSEARAPAHALLPAAPSRCASVRARNRRCAAGARAGRCLARPSHGPRSRRSARGRP